MEDNIFWMTRLQTKPLPRPKRRPSDRTVGEGWRGLLLFGLVTLLLFGALVPRLVFLQLLQGDRNRELADENRIRLIPKRPERGKILDRKGRVLANSKFTYSVFVWPIVQKQPTWPRTLQVLSEILQIPVAEIQKPLEQAGENSPSLVRVSQGLTFGQVVALSERRSDLVGVEIDKEAVRHYPHGELASQVIGYIGEISAEEFERKQAEGYRLGDVVGQIGVEASHEEELRGAWGGQQVEVDGAGRIFRILGQKPSEPGQDITLTLDLDVQKAAEKALGKRTGAVVALDPRDGSVLAMASYPGFNPNWFARRVSEAQWQELQNRKNPFVNRATQGFPPASTFKIVTAIAGLESGNFSPSSILQTYSAVHGVGDWNGAGFGPIGFKTALQWSSNTFFGQIGVKTGPKDLIRWAKTLGLGQKTGIDLPGEAAGFLPDPAWKQEVFEDEWYPADSVMFSIGQGAVQVSPLQVATFFAVPANGGYRVRPHLLKTNDPPDKWRQPLNLNPKNLKVIREGLRAVVTSGTGTALNTKTIPPAAGKSGTGEDPPRPSHTWFGSYAPFDQPEIVVVAFGENSGGGGGSTCGPIALKVLEAYFKHNPPQKKKAG